MSNIPLTERAKWLGASEVAALFGVSPHCTRFELWHQKKGNIPSHDLSQNERVNAGQFLEPSIGRWATHKWNWPIENVNEYLVNPRVDRMGCSLDFGTGDGEPVEIKNVDFLIFRDNWETEGDTIIDAPLHFLIQVQHQLSCIPDAERGWLIPCVSGNRLYRMEIARHEKLIATIEKRVREFWKSVEANTPPDPDFDADAESISMLYGGQGDDVVDLRGNERMHELCEEYLNAHELTKAGDKRKKAALAEMKTLLQDARGALVDEGYRIKASFIKETTIHRKEHFRFLVTHKTEEK